MQLDGLKHCSCAERDSPAEVQVGSCARELIIWYEPHPAVHLSAAELGADLLHRLSCPGVRLCLLKGQYCAATSGVHSYGLFCWSFLYCVREVGFATARGLSMEGGT